MRRKLIVAMLSGILCACPIEVYADAEMTQEETDMNSLSEEEYKKNSRQGKTNAKMELFFSLRHA